MNIFQYLASQFYSKKIDNKQYVEHEPFIRQFKSQKGKAKTTIMQFVELNGLDYTMVDIDGNVLDATLDNYHYKKHKMLISIDSIVSAEQLIPLVEQSYATAVANMQANTIVDSSDTTMEQTDPVVTTIVKMETNLPTQFDLIELTESESFKDMNDNPVTIEVRGSRTEAGILFRVKHIGAYLGMENLAHTLRDKRLANKKGIHWIKLYQYSSGIYSAPLKGLYPLDEATNESTQKPIWVNMYLTLDGLMKVIFSSTSANENVIQLRNWVIHLVYVHRFGSNTERLDLVETLAPYKKCLNKLSGIYLIRIGKVKDLRESMNISNDLYPPNKFDSAYVFKFGRSDDIMTRFKQHCERTGYGKYSSTVSLEWFVVIPPKLCSNAESDLNKYFELHQFKFAFNDGAKDHTELIIIKPGSEKQHTKNKYFELVKNFPGETNALIQQLTEIKLERDQTIERMQLLYENNQLKSDAEAALFKSKSSAEIAQLKSDNENNQLKSDNNLLKATHQIEMLQLKLDMAQLQINRQ